ncbi:1,4-dihydroxy-2-naphthoate octaprenyltransferase [Thecamonas trahens ATCC 50062]|uniref:1,4-dihydroxy-2-naphthoate octaprenyltransferase n=1 Tax=Thecamonas trahens ATCC 50062 TaxID=461836 RepID=A0A0L0DEN6_THETB|nr:1,4-dihydroxy-2-naphthoate octaprenyltransferase [Thecamonas trahens ATCC 50062]KNC50764.1 1,4-dihydroxy-2-naphthoate octaprenyltransferase [Thecamonas trahens ATCC 50062]|eukprot:XP_013756726.1 1,4-dihydroxy-2-naphthoate octaprenyltransferase [Thecamonas trahens ATCC 50062]
MEPRPDSTTPRAVVYFAATRPPFLLAAAVPVALGLAAVAADGAAVYAVRALATAIGAVLALAGANILNDYYDAESGTDEINTGRIFPFTGGSRFIQNKVIAKENMLKFGLALLAATAAIGLALTAVAGVGLVGIGVLGLVIAWGYTAPPLNLAARGLGEAAVAASFGLLIPVGTYYAQTSGWSTSPLVIGTPYALLVSNLLVINMFPDAKADAAVGKRTSVVRLGPARASYLYVGSTSAALCWLWATMPEEMGATGQMLAGLPLALSLRAGLDVVAFADEPSKLARAIPLTIAAALLHGTLYAVALVWF